MTPDREEVLRSVGPDRRRFLRTVIAGAAFAPPLFMSFSLDGLSVDLAEAGPSPSPSPSHALCSNMTFEPPVVFHLDKGTGGSLLLTEIAPTSTTAKFTDSPVVSRSNGNPWKKIGAWDAFAGRSCLVEEVSDLHVWLGLRNSDDQGTQFDLKAEFFVGDDLVATGETDCVAGLVRNPSQAREVVVSFGAAEMKLLSGAVTLVLWARIGTGCPGHASATGLRVYYGSPARDSSFEIQFQ
jgi:hypothetical protein